MSCLKLQFWDVINQCTCPSLNCYFHWMVLILDRKVRLMRRHGGDKVEQLLCPAPPRLWVSAINDISPDSSGIFGRTIAHPLSTHLPPPKRHSQVFDRSQGCRINHVSLRGSRTLPVIRLDSVHPFHSPLLPRLRLNHSAPSIRASKCEVN